MAVHVHVSLLHLLVTAIEILIVLLTVKLVAANFVGRSNTADVSYGVL